MGKKKHELTHEEYEAYCSGSTLPNDKNDIDVILMVTILGAVGLVISGLIGEMINFNLFAIVGALIGGFTGYKITFDKNRIVDDFENPDMSH